MSKITQPKKEGKEVYVLLFDGKKGRYKNGKLNPIQKTKCISIVDARAVLLKYLRPNSIPSYERCRDIIKKDRYLSVINIDGVYILG